MAIRNIRNIHISDIRPGFVKPPMIEGSNFPMQLDVWEVAVNIDVTKDDFEARATSLLPKDKTIAVYCRSGRRSKKAAGILVENGYKIIELNTGIKGWTDAGKETVR